MFTQSSIPKDASTPWNEESWAKVVERCNLCKAHNMLMGAQFVTTVSYVLYVVFKAIQLEIPSAITNGFLGKSLV